MSGFVDKLLNLIGLRRITHREQALEELAEMHGNEFFIRTGLVFNEDIIMNMHDMTYDEWLDSPSTTKRIFKDERYGDIV